MIAKARNCHL